MELDRKQFAQIMQRFEIVEAELAVISHKVETIEQRSLEIAKMSEASDTRLMVAGLALLLNHPSVSNEDLMKFNRGFDPLGRVETRTQT